MPLITSLQNPRVKDAVRLRDRRHREKQGRILIDGARELRRAIAAGVKLLEVFVCEPLCHSDDAQRQLLARRLAAMRRRGMAGARRCSSGWRSASGRKACSAWPRCRGRRWRRLNRDGGGSSTATPTAGSTAPKLIAVLEGVEKPGNVGAVLRSADAAGVSAVIVADGRTDLFNPNAIRASLGTIFTMPVCEATSGEVLAWLRERQVPRSSLLGSMVPSPYTKVDYRGPTAIVLGRRGGGTFADLERRRHHGACDCRCSARPTA